MAIKYVIFDVGGVCYPYSLNKLDDWALEHCCNREEFIAKGGVKSFDYNPYMRGEVDFSKFSKELCEYAGISYYKEIENEIDEKLHEGVGDFFPQTLECMDKIKQKGIKVGLLSNALACLCDTADSLVDKDLCFVSYELKCLKPNREIYEKLIEKLKCKPEEILFIDDKEKNVMRAIDLGINGIVYKKETIVKDVNRFLNFDNLKLFKDFQR